MLRVYEKKASADALLWDFYFQYQYQPQKSSVGQTLVSEPVWQVIKSAKTRLHVLLQMYLVKSYTVTLG